MISMLYIKYGVEQVQTYKILIDALHVIEALEIEYIFSPIEYTEYQWWEVAK